MEADPFGLVGSTIAGRYAVEAVIGEGGFCVVYRARHILWDRRVAIKAFRGADGCSEEVGQAMLRAFVQEGAMLAELSERTTAIVQARDMATLVTAGGQWVPYLVLEWLEGECLESVLWQERGIGLAPRTFAQAVALLEPVILALTVAHAKGICHRDLKPSNVFVLGDPRGDDCTTKLLDFGVATFFADTRRAPPARRARTPACAYTPSYGAPEQISDAFGITGPWTDVFALALILVELVTGREALAGQSADELARIATDPARRPTPRSLGVSVSDAVERVMTRALAVYPAERWQSASSFWRALSAAVADRPVATARVRRRSASGPPAGIALAIVFALAASGVVDVASANSQGSAAATLAPTAH